MISRRRWGDGGVQGNDALEGGAQVCVEVDSTPARGWKIGGRAAAARARPTGLRSMRTPPIGSGQSRARRLCDPSLDLERRNAGGGSGLMLAALQHGL